LSPPLLAVRGLRKAWAGRAVLDHLDLELGSGQHTLVRGASGAGKSTLLGVLARLVPPDAGEILLDGAPIAGLGGATRYRRERLGLVFQDPLLVDSLTAFQNLEMAAMQHTARGPGPSALLERLGLQPRAAVRAGVLSRGERQRLALARAFVGRPRLVLADEPTASLDPPGRDAVLDQLFALADAAEATVLLVSHDAVVAARPELHRRLSLDAGRLHEKETPDAPTRR
jgi:ABC-type lipoprotein export system ATPase subunit